MADYDPVGLLRDRLRALQSRLQRSRPATQACWLVGLSWAICMLLVSGNRAEVAYDRWGRQDLGERFPEGADAQTLVLGNDSARPVLVEIVSPAWKKARCELLLPGDSAWVDVARQGDVAPVAHVVALDIGAPDARRDFELSPGWVHTSLDIEADGSVARDESPIGDSSPKRGLVWFETAYRLPVRVAVPYDQHERPDVVALARREWIGPGTDDSMVGCAYAMRDGVRASCWVPHEFGQPSDITLDESGPARIHVAADGSISREPLSLARRFRHWAGM